MIRYFGGGLRLHYLWEIKSQETDSSTLVPVTFSDTDFKSPIKLNSVPLEPSISANCSSLHPNESGSSELPPVCSTHSASWSQFGPTKLSVQTQPSVS